MTKMNKIAFALLTATIIKEYKTITPQNIEELNERLLKLANLAGHNFIINSNVYLEEPVKSKYETHGSRETFRGHFTDYSSGSTEFNTGWQCGSYYVGEKENKITLSSRSFTSWGMDRSESSHTEYVLDGEGKVFNTAINFNNQKGFAIYFANLNVEIYLPLSGEVSHEVKVYDWNGNYNSGNYAYDLIETLEIPSSYEIASQKAMEIHFENTIQKTVTVLVVECPTEKLEHFKHLYNICGNYSKTNVDKIIHKPIQEGQSQIYALIEEHYPNRIESSIQGVSFIYFKKNKISSTGWGWHSVDFNSSDYEEIEIEYDNPIPSPTRYEYPVFYNRTAENHDKDGLKIDLSIYSRVLKVVDGKLIIVKDWDGKWDKAIMPYANNGWRTDGYKMPIVFDENQWSEFSIIETALKGKIYKWAFEKHYPLLESFFNSDISLYDYCAKEIMYAARKLSVTEKFQGRFQFPREYKLSDRMKKYAIYLIANNNN